MIDEYTMIRALMRVLVAKGVATEDEIFAEAEAYRREMDAIQEQLGGFIARQNRCKACQGNGQLPTIDNGLADCWACKGSGRNPGLPIGLREMDLTPEAAVQLDRILSEPSKSTLTPRRVPEIE